MNKAIAFIHKSSFKSALWMLSLLAIAATFAVTLSQFRSTDKIPQVKLIDMPMRKKNRDFAAVVRTGLFLKNFEVFDVANDRFVFGAVVWFEFNTDQVMPEILEKFSFINGKILDRSPGDVRVNGTTMFTRYDVRVEAKSQLTYYRFPFDDHRISLAITNDFVTPSEIFFTVDNSSFGMKPDLFSSASQIAETGTAWGYADLLLDDNDSSKSVQRPVVVYSINVYKSGIRGILIIFIPLFAALFLSLFSFFLALASLVLRTTLAMTSLTAILSYRFIIERMMPSVDYFTTTDSIYTLILLISLCVFTFQIVIQRYTGPQGQMSPQAATVLELLNSILFIVITVGATALMAYMILG